MNTNIPEDWIQNYPIGSVWNFNGHIWGKGKAIIIGHSTLSQGTSSLTAVLLCKDGEVIAEHIYDNQAFVLRKRLNEPQSVDALLGWVESGAA